MLHFRLHGGGARGFTPLWSLREGCCAWFRNRVRVGQGRRLLRFLLHWNKIDAWGSTAFHNHLGGRWSRSPVLCLPGSLGKRLLIRLGKYSWCLVGREGRFIARRTRVAQGRSVRELNWLLLMGFECTKLMLRASEHPRRVVHVVVSRATVVRIRKFRLVPPGLVPTVLPKMVHRRCLTAGVGGILGERRPQARGVGCSLGLWGELAVRVWGVLPTAGIGCVVGKGRAAVWGNGGSRGRKGTVLQALQGISQL